MRSSAIIELFEGTRKVNKASIISHGWQRYSGGYVIICNGYRHTKPKQQNKTEAHLRVILLKKFSFSTVLLLPIIIDKLLYALYCSTRGVFALLVFIDLPSLMGYAARSSSSMRYVSSATSLTALRISTFYFEGSGSPFCTSVDSLLCSRM